MTVPVWLRTHMESMYQIVNLNSYLDSYAHHGFYYLEGNSAVDGKRIFVKMDGTLGEAASREAIIIQKLAAQKGNINFPRLIAYEGSGPLSFVALEWIDGIQLEKLLMLNIYLSYRQRQFLLKQLCAILDTLHETEIIHRDIRPANIMVEMREEEWRLVLIDFAFSIGKDSNTFKELAFFLDRPELLEGLGGECYKPESYKWDDAYSIREVACNIDTEYERNFPEIWNHLNSMQDKLVHLGP
ncbi:protein kinase domain-containing protein [Cohnella soli]|uniref:Lipopolysaccharide kinase InaA family protein n=1 Tax=Cohnella soli TaxID=425005 RepID=A0ABW0I1S0_9BACL